MEVRELLERATVLADSGELTAAEEQVRQAINLAPRNDAAHFLLALFYQRQGKFQDAITSVNAAIEIAPRKMAYFNLLGACHLLRNEAVVAEFCFLHAIGAEPGYVEPYNNLGLLLLGKMRTDEAARLLEQALKLAPADVNVLCNLARAHHDRGSFKQALALFEQALRLQPDKVSAQLGCAVCLGRMNHPERALAILDRLAQKPVPDPVLRAEILRNKAALLGNVGRTDDAFLALEAAFAAAPAAFDVAHARALARKIRPDEPFFSKLREFETQIDSLTGPAKTHLCYALGKANLDVGNVDKAASYYASGGANVWHTQNYNERPDMELFAAVKRNINGRYLSSLAGKGSDSQRPIFVLGMERSGTTLVAQILGSHPDVFAAGELTFLPEVLGGTRLPDGFLLPEAGGQGFGPDAALRLRAERYLQEIEALEGSSGRRHIVDKMPGNFTNLGMIHALFPNARIIHCRRDPLDTCISSYTTFFSQGLPWSYDLGTLGRRYRAYWDLMEHWRRELPGRFLELRYEQTVDDVEQAARTLLDWCGLEWDDRVLEFHKTNLPVYTASVMQVRQPIYNSSVDRWKAWEPYIQPLLDEVGDIEQQYRREAR